MYKRKHYLDPNLYHLLLNERLSLLIPLSSHDPDFNPILYPCTKCANRSALIPTRGHRVRTRSRWIPTSTLPSFVGDPTSLSTTLHNRREIACQLRP